MSVLDYDVGAAPGNADADMKMFQRRGHLSRAFPDCHTYVLNCCANDSAGLNLPDMLNLMRTKWLPKEKMLMEERRLLVKQLEVDPPKCWVEGGEDEGAKKKTVKKKSRLQGGGGVAKAKPKKAPAQSDWAPVNDENAMAIARPVGQASRVDVVRPGLIVMKKILSMNVQQHFADVSIALGTPTNGLSGGWYRVDGKGEKHWNTGDGWGQMSESMDCFPAQYRELCLKFLAMAREESQDTPAMIPDLVLMNYYTPENPGIYWHRDNSSQERRAVALGLPVVSFSIGDSCVFSWRMEPDHPVQDLVLDSGDVLVFGGPSRLILHSVPKIYPNTAPKQLKMPKGRLNLTFRQQDSPA